MKKSDEDWVNKSMEFRGEGRLPVGKPRKTWLDSVETGMAEFAQLIFRYCLNHAQLLYIDFDCVKILNVV